MATLELESPGSLAQTEMSFMPDELWHLLGNISSKPYTENYYQKIKPYPWRHTAMVLSSSEYFIVPDDDTSIDGLDTRIGQMQHVYQVGVTARALAMHLGNLQGEYADDHELIGEVDLYAAAHDEGRIIEVNGNHARHGQKILRAYGAPDHVADFAIEHDRMGIGTFDHKSSIVEQVEACIEYRDEKAIEVNDEAIKQVVKDRVKELGLAKTLVIIADMSKEYIDPDDPHNSSIAAVTRERLYEQIERKTRTVGGYDADSQVCQREYAAAEFLLGLIDYVQDEYDLNYEKAVKSAAITWEEHDFDGEIERFVKGEITLEDSPVIQMNYLIDNKNLVYGLTDMQMRMIKMGINPFAYRERGKNALANGPPATNGHSYRDKPPGYRKFDS